MPLLPVGNNTVVERKLYYMRRVLHFAEIPVTQVVLQGSQRQLECNLEQFHKCGLAVNVELLGGTFPPGQRRKTHAGLMVIFPALNPTFACFHKFIFFARNRPEFLPSAKFPISVWECRNCFRATIFRHGLLF